MCVVENRVWRYAFFLCIADITSTWNLFRVDFWREKEARNRKKKSDYNIIFKFLVRSVNESRTLYVGAFVPILRVQLRFVIICCFYHFIYVPVFGYPNNEMFFLNVFADWFMTMIWAKCWFTSEGAHHHLKIFILPTSYVPSFVQCHEIIIKKIIALSVV